MKFKFKRCSPFKPPHEHWPPIVETETGDWIDLKCAESIHLKKGDFALVPLGFAAKMPKGYEAWVVPRSSTFKKYGVIQTNGIGIIDNAYCGDNDEWRMPIYATRDVVIPCGTRLCQFRIMKNAPKLKFVEVESLNATNRGGFGSTGN